MKEIYGKYTSATIYADIIEQEALNQIEDICNHIVFENAKIAIMPDVHAGKGCVVGFTALSDYPHGIIPNIVGVDISCTVSTRPITFGTNNIDDELLKKIDDVIKKHIPYGFAVRDKIHESVMSYGLDNKIKEVCNLIKDDKPDYHLRSIGSLGSGNHFIEVNKSKDSVHPYWFTIHCGSRNFGHKIATYFQNVAVANNNHERKDLCYLTPEQTNDYLYCMEVAKLFAIANHQIIVHEIVHNIDIDVESVYMQEIMCNHNFITNWIDCDLKSNLLIRKGAVASLANSDPFGNVLIPLNMRDGILICKGKNNPDWNYSAPHGAGRLYSRKKAKKQLSLEDYQKTMEGVYSTSIDSSTLDEAPMAYKDYQYIIDSIAYTADVVERLLPIYNFKASE